MKKTKLSSVPSFDMLLFGITSQAKEYKLAWWINRELGIKLVKKDDLEIEIKEIGKIAISNFTFDTEHCIFRLLKNKLENDSGGYLLKELQRFDFLLTIDNKSDTFDLNGIGNKLKNIPEILYSQSIIVDNLKDKENLIF